MVKKTLSKVQKLTVSAMVMATLRCCAVLYAELLFRCVPDPQLQRLCMRSLTCFRSWFCRLVSLISFANFLFGGLGLLDWFGGCFVGIIVTAIIVLIRQARAGAAG